MSICSLITEGQDCTSNIPGGGTEARVLVLNHSDVLGATLDSQGRVINLNIAFGTSGFFFNGYRNDAKLSESVEEAGLGTNMFKHHSGFTLYGRTQDKKEVVRRLSRGKFIFVVENIGKDEGSFEILGLECGLSMNVGTTRDAHSNNGLYVITFSTMDGPGNYEDQPPRSVWLDDYGTTLALVESWESNEPPPFNPPTNLEAFPFSENAISLSWEDNSTIETGTQIWRSTSPSGPFTHIATLEGSGTEYTDSDGLAIATTYYYKVRGVNNNSVSEFSNIANATTFNAFSFTIKTDNAGVSANNQFTLPLLSIGTYAFIAAWGDGVREIINVYNQAEVTHTYPSAGTYEIKIYGPCAGFNFNNGGDRLKMLNISRWGDVEFITSAAFYGCANMTCTATDLPDISGTTALENFFRGCTNFNGVLAGLDTAHITDFDGMFRSAASFNRPIDSWDTGSATSMIEMFRGAQAFNQSLNSWDVSGVTTMQGMFTMLNEDGGALVSSAFNGNITSWDTGSVTNMSFMFYGCTAFNQDIGGWDVSSVTTMQNMFRNCTVFNQDLDTWDVSSVTNMQHMFASMGAFNGNIGTWDVSSVTNMSFMFIANTAINQSLNSWNTGSVTTMQNMFRQATAWNGNITSWNTGSVTNMEAMFRDTSFNQNIGGWNVSNVTNMASMFLNNAAFDQDLGAWNIDDLTNATTMFAGATLSTANYDSLLNGWAGGPSVNNGVPFHGGNSTYSVTGQPGRNTLTGTYSWTITDGGMV